MTKHIPVLPAEVLELLDPQPGQVIVDATIGAGGHAGLILEKLGPTGRLIGLDRDPGMLAVSRDTLAERELPPPAGASRPTVDLVHGSFEDLPEILQKLQTGPVDAILADLGFCSDQLADPQRGLSFQNDGPLDMRLDPTHGEPASAMIRRLRENDLVEIFWRFGEERYSRRIARKIVELRTAEPLTTTGQLAELVRSCVPRETRQKHPFDPATRVFLALRIAVNDELGALERFLQVLPDWLRPGGKIAIVSFHSLEDRLVKKAFRGYEGFEEITRKPRVAGAEEVRLNPRAAAPSCEWPGVDPSRKCERHSPRPGDARNPW